MPPKVQTSEAPRAKPVQTSAMEVAAHLKSLFNPPNRPKGFAALDGYRAFLCVWIITFHSLAYMVGFYPDMDLKDLSGRPELGPLMIGLIAVDAFFVLTGFLLAVPLFEDDAKEKRVVLRDWYYRRISRMVPPHFIMLAIQCFVMITTGGHPMSRMPSEFQQRIHHKHFPEREFWPHNCGMAWANVLYVSNELPGAGCMGHTWSLSVQFQWYLVLPLLFKWFGGRMGQLVKLLVAMTIVSVAIRAFGFFQLVSLNPQTIDYFFFSFTWYDSTLARLNAFTLKATWFRVLSLLNIVVIVILNARWSAWFGDGSLLEPPGNCAVHRYQIDGSILQLAYYVLLTVGGPLSAYIFCYVIFISVEQIGPEGRLLQRVLGHRWWFPVAQLSYVAYLCHPLIIISSQLFLWHVPIATLGPLIVNAVWAVCASLLFAFLFYIFIEKPLDVALRNHDHPRLASIGFWYCMLLIVASLLMHTLVSLVMFTYTPPPDMALGGPDPRPAEKLAYAVWLKEHGRSPVP